MNGGEELLSLYYSVLMQKNVFIYAYMNIRRMYLNKII